MTRRLALKEKGRIRLDTRGMKNYGRALRSAIYGLWRGYYSRYDFISEFTMSIQDYYRQAWYEGAAECGIRPDELTTEERETLRRETLRDLFYVLDLASDIESGSKSNGGKLAPLYRRAELWINRYNAIRNMAKTMACQDGKLRWEYGDTIHCSSCLKLNGRVYRASVWQKYDIHPQHPSLECGGWRCQCRLVPTDEPTNRGRPPAIP